jgi:hypothetical protein
MGLLNLASVTSAWRGYEYYKAGNVLTKIKLSETEYKGVLQGSDNKRYEVFIDIEHPRKSHCNCPHAKGKRIICKHQVALYFSVFPREAEKYYKEVLEYEEEEERRQEELDKKVVAYIKSLSKDELRQTLYEVLYDGADWVFERFVREHIDY